MLRCEDLVRMPESQLGAQDLAEMNLACAEGLPDAKNLDVAGWLQRLAEWTDYVRAFTRRALPAFDRKPADFNHSPGYFRALCLVTALQRDLGLRYNPAKIPADVPLETADIFIHGAVLGQGGTCASLPVVYAVIGRRLGYPLKLVAARVGNVGHLFVRWDDPKGERFNIEATSQGLSCHPDDHYRTGAYQVDPAVEEMAYLLKSMTAREELASFLAERGHRWLDFDNLHGAVQAFSWAAELVPLNACYGNTLAALRKGCATRSLV